MSGAASAKPRVVLVMVECVCADADVPALELSAETWAQDVRYRVSGDATTRNAGALVLNGSLATLGAAFALAASGVANVD